jgi:hypothetical protein
VKQNHQLCLGGVGTAGIIAVEKSNKVRKEITNKESLLI